MISAPQAMSGFVILLIVLTLFSSFEATSREKDTPRARWRVRFQAGLILLVMAVVAVFFWPTIKHYLRF